MRGVSFHPELELVQREARCVPLPTQSLALKGSPSPGSRTAPSLVGGAVDALALQSHATVHTTAAACQIHHRRFSRVVESSVTMRLFAGEFSVSGCVKPMSMSGLWGAELVSPGI